VSLTNDRPKCGGLLSTFFVSCWAYYIRVGIEVCLFGGKLMLTFFIQRLQTLFYFATFFTFFNVFLFLGERFFHLRY